MQEPLPASATQPSQPGVAKAPATTAPQGHPKTNYLYVVGLTGVAAIGGLLFGFDSGVVNGTVAALASAFGTHAAATGFAVASVLVRCAFGAFGAGALANRIGRRPTMIIDAVLFLGSAFATGAAGSVGVFIGSRIVAGLAIGAASVLAPMYIAEVAPAHVGASGGNVPQPVARRRLGGLRGYKLDREFRCDGHFPAADEACRPGLDLWLIHSCRSGFRGLCLHRGAGDEREGPRGNVTQGEDASPG